MYIFNALVVLMVGGGAFYLLNQTIRRLSGDRYSWSQFPVWFALMAVSSLVALLAGGLIAGYPAVVAFFGWLLYLPLIAILMTVRRAFRGPLQ